MAGGGLCEERSARGGSAELGREQRQKAEAEKVSRGKEKEKRAGQSRVEHTRVLEGKWFTKNFSVNRFPKFC